MNTNELIPKAEDKIVCVKVGKIKRDPKQWFYTKDPKHAGRCEFVGELNLDNDYIGKSVTGLYGRSANPVKYINL